MADGRVERVDDIEQPHVSRGVAEPHAMDRPGGAVERIQREVWRGLPRPQLRAKHREALTKLEGPAYSLLHRPPPSLHLCCAVHACLLCLHHDGSTLWVSASISRAHYVRPPTHLVRPAYCCWSGSGQTNCKSSSE